MFIGSCFDAIFIRMRVFFFLLLFLGTLVLKLRCNLVCLINWLVEVG